MNVIVVQSEGAVKFLALELVLLHVFVRADVADYSALGIVMRHLLNCSILINYHAIISHVVLDIVMPAIDCTIGILQLRNGLSQRNGLPSFRWRRRIRLNSSVVQIYVFFSFWQSFIPVFSSIASMFKSGKSQNANFLGDS
jgi:hypothetical protein